MHIIIAAIGKCKSGPEHALYAHYAARLAWKLTVKEYEHKAACTSAVRKEKEAQLLLGACEEAEHIIALDERGDAWGSMELAAHIGKVRDRSVRRLAFVIGGADGLHESIRAKAHLCLSLGRLTWPHMLVRGLLAEQLYRAQTLLSGHPYHRQ